MRARNIEGSENLLNAVNPELKERENGLGRE